MGQLCSTEGGGEGDAHGPICLTQSLPCQLSSEKRVLRMKNVSRPPCQAEGTLKYCCCFFWGWGYTHTHSSGTTKKIDFLTNWRNIFFFETCYIKWPNNSILKKRMSTKQEKTHIHITLSHKQQCYLSDQKSSPKFCGHKRNYIFPGDSRHSEVIQVWPTSVLRPSRELRNPHLKSKLGSILLLPRVWSHTIKHFCSNNFYSSVIWETA